MVLESYFFFVFQNIILACKVWESKSKTSSLLHNDSSLYGKFQHQMSNFPHLIQNFLSRCMHFYHAHPSYAHEHFRLSPMHWVKFEPNFDAQFLYQYLVSSLWIESTDTTIESQNKSLMLNCISCSCACFMCVTLLVLILLHADLVVHDKMFALICILLKLWARTKFEAQSK